MKVAAAQISCVPGDVAANLRKIREFSSRAKDSGVDLIVFPEMADTGYSMPAIQKHAAAWSGGAVPELQKLAKELALALVSGVSEREGEVIYNSQVFIDASGEIAARYRKTHLFTGTSVPENKCFAPGSEFSSFTFGGLRFGFSICYDLRFPEVFRMLAIEQRAKVFVLSSAWPFPRLDHFRALIVARAIENQSYVIASNRVGTDDGVTCCGSSVIVDPYGVVVAAASTDREELIQAEISEGTIDSVRGRMAVFAERRADLY
jgi:predicted amidohydrolase